MWLWYVFTRRAAKDILIDRSVTLVVTHAVFDRWTFEFLQCAIEPLFPLVGWLAVNSHARGAYVTTGWLTVQFHA